MSKAPCSARSLFIRKTHEKIKNSSIISIPKANLTQPFKKVELFYSIKTDIASIPKGIFELEEAFMIRNRKTIHFNGEMRVTCM